MRIHSKQVIATVIIAVIIFAIPLTIVLLQKQQEIRSRANAQLVKLSLSPAEQTIQPGSSIIVEVSADAGSYNVSGIDFKLVFDSDALEIVSFQPESTFNSELTKTINNTTGNFRYAAVNFSTTQITGSGIPVGKLTLKGKPVTAGRTGTVRFTDVKMSASGQPALSIGENTNGSYAIAQTDVIPTNTQTPSATPSPTQTPTQPTNTPIPQPSPTITPFPTNTPIPTEIPTPTDVPTPTFAPIPTLVPGGARISLNLTLSGLGDGIGSNPNPRVKQKRATICAYPINTDTSADNNCSKGRKTDGFITFNTTSKTFDQATFDLGIVTEGEYEIFITVDKYLRKRVPGVKILKANTTTPIQPVQLKSGDITGDNIIDVQDYNAYVNCFGAKFNTPSCLYPDTTDLNDDGKHDTTTDFSDYKIFLQNISTREGD